MYIVTSKPKRISVNSGLVHIVFSGSVKLMVFGGIAPRLFSGPAACVQASDVNPRQPTTQVTGPVRIVEQRPPAVAQKISICCS
jgi:hypothetical protein